MTENYFDDDVAATYDDDAEMFEPGVVDPVVDCLARLAGDGRALELGIGTGRIALPLSQRGVEVHGIELSPAMASRLAVKPGAKEIAVALGDFSSTQVPGPFTLVYLVFNTIMNLTTQALQVACFRNAAAHLVSGGYFVIEVMVPELQKLPFGEKEVVFDLSDTHWGLDEYDVPSQGLVSHHLRISGNTLAKSSTPFRYVWPSELDLMAQLAGMSLRTRHGGWQAEPFTATSGSHVSVWQKP